MVGTEVLAPCEAADKAGLSGTANGERSEGRVDYILLLPCFQLCPVDSRWGCIAILEVPEDGGRVGVDCVAGGGGAGPSGVPRGEEVGIFQERMGLG
jgi:hypothetical protein